ncbi:Receptor-like serine/threonine-protein kinase [Citrus sinensis]|uniref:Receptor-like serine/threonine-protein kinase n=1 Tax=Citrus sinensis TaxID=2711 RepID=A0ACB8N102_CITSI|nr:Receptor-like serine/threonine-protein kinase [Citrus sinensis]
MASCSLRCLFPILSVLISLHIIPTSAATTGNCSVRASNIYCLDSGLPSTWYNNNSVIMNGWQMRVFLLLQDAGDFDFYCGFYCNGTCNSYVFSVVAVRENDHRVVWSANKDRPVKANAMVQLKTDGLVLRDSDGTQIWASNHSGNSVHWMNLDPDGNLSLFNNESKIIWKSSAEKISLSPPNPSITPNGTLTPEGKAPPPVTGIAPTEENMPKSPKKRGTKLVVVAGGSTAGGLLIPYITPNGTLTPEGNAAYITPTYITPTNRTSTPDGNAPYISPTYITPTNGTSTPEGNAPYITPTFITPTNGTSTPEGNVPYITPTNGTLAPEGNVPYITPTNGTLAPEGNAPPPATGIAPTEENRPKSPKKGRTKLVAVVAGSTAGGLLIICIVIVLYIVKVRRNVGEEEHLEDDMKQVPGLPVRFSYEDLQIATEDFKERIGGGGFGTVFKGVLKDGSKIAVKRLDRMEQGMREFVAEVETIGSLHHFNLVRLIGFCVEKSCRLLVYEYMSNGSLEKWIFVRDPRPCLDWQTRKKIILDVAKGLTYLHEDCRRRVAHLDIKPQNILLDENFNAKVSDFGLAQLIERDESLVQATMRGTPGYIAPEWRKSKISVKVDIYSFGIVLLEVVSARRNLDRSRSESSCHLLRLLQEKAKEDRLFDIVESFGEEVENHRDEMIRMIKIGAWCLQNDPGKRPSMSTVVKVLEGVMEVDANINYKFAQAMPYVSIVNSVHVSSRPTESVLSNPR